MGFKPNIKEYDEDDWADKSYGIGWAGKDKFLDNPRCKFEENQDLLESSAECRVS